MTTIQERLRDAFDGDDMPKKNLALRAAHDRIDALEKALRRLNNLTAHDAAIVVAALDGDQST